MSRSILFGIWSLPIAKLTEPTMSKLRRMGYKCVPFALQSYAQDFFKQHGYPVVGVSADGKTVDTSLLDDAPIFYEMRVNQIVEGYGRPPEWDLDKVRKNATITRSELSRFPPEEVAAVVLWGGRLSFQQVMHDYARTQDIPLILLERGHFPETIIVDEFELDENTEFRTMIWPFLARNDDAGIQRQGERIRQEFVSARNTLENQSNANLSREDFLNALNLKPGKKLIFLPLQVPIDTNIIFRTFDIPGNEDLVGTVTKAVEGLEDIEILVKFHPGDKWTDRTRFCARFPGIRVVEGVHVHDAIRHSSLVITINSQVCVESILYEKPVITCGRSHFGGLVNHYHSKTKPALMAAVRNSLAQPRLTTPGDRNRYVFGLRDVYLVDNPDTGSRRIHKKIERHDTIRTGTPAAREMPRLRIGIATALLHQPDNPTFWLRTERIRRGLEEFGTVTYLTPENIHSQTWDVVWVAHRFNNDSIRSILHRTGCLVFDINDALFDNPLHGGSTREFAATSDMVVFSSDYLRSRYGHLARRAIVLPDGYEAPPEDLATDDRAPNSVIWTGYRNNLPYLDEISEGLAAAQRELGIGLKLLTSRHNDHMQDNQKLADSIPGLRFQFHEWARETYYPVLARADIGIAPLSINSFCMSKTANKLLTYQAAGLCVIAQAGIPSYETHIRHGETGLLAFTPQDYCDAIKFLHDHPDEKERIRANGKASLQAFSEESLQEILRGIVFEAYQIASTRHYLRDKF